jgi:hypothetical protein
MADQEPQEHSQPNQAHWRAMQEPHESVAAANTALQAFYEELGALRSKHRLADVLVIARVTCITQDGDERDARTPMFYGDELHAESLAAYGYGHYVSQRQQMMSDYIRGSVITTPKAGGK